MAIHCPSVGTRFIASVAPHHTSPDYFVKNLYRVRVVRYGGATCSQNWPAESFIVSASPALHLVCSQMIPCKKMNRIRPLMGERHFFASSYQGSPRAGMVTRGRNGIAVPTHDDLPCAL